MSVRLNVVLSQSAGGSPAQRELEADVVARLLGAAGIDLSLIGSLERLGDSSTDRLMLEQLSGDVALLTWDHPAEAAERLAAAGVAGRRTPHRLDPAAAAGTKPDHPQTADRRIYCHHLHGQSAPVLQESLEQLLAERRVVTFQLAPSPQPRPAKPERPAKPARPEKPSGEAIIQRAADGEPEIGPGTANAQTADPWDALVDELNDSGI